jgi:predicted hydrolase (HD superfamily)
VTTLSKAGVLRYALGGFINRDQKKLSLSVQLSEPLLSLSRGGMKRKDFARNVNRAHVALCEELDIPQVDFIALSLEAMTAIGAQLGL